MEEKKACLQTALRSLTRKMSTEQEMIEKLQKWTYSQEAIDATIQELKRLRYLDDTRFIHALAEELYLYKKYGPIRVKQALVRKHFPSSLIDSAMDDHQDPDRDQKNALYWGEKKMRALANKERPKQIRSLQQHLYTKGFTPGTVRAIVQKLIFERLDGEE